MICGLMHNTVPQCIDAVNAQDKTKESNRVVQELAKEAGWAECPNCHHTIERSSGCKHMTCVKCRFEFCYTCNKFGNAIKNIEDAKWSNHQCPCQLRGDSIYS
jgi:hypothetical protein